MSTKKGDKILPGMVIIGELSLPKKKDLQLTDITWYATVYLMYYLPNTYASVQGNCSYFYS